LYENLNDLGYFGRRKLSLWVDGRIQADGQRTNASRCRCSFSISTITLMGACAGAGVIGAVTVSRPEASALLFQRLGAMNMSVSNTHRPTGTRTKRPSLIIRPGSNQRPVTSGVAGGGSSVRWWSMAGPVTQESECFISAMESISGAGIAITSPMKALRRAINLTGCF